MRITLSLRLGAPRLCTVCAHRMTVSVEWLSIQVALTVWAAGSQPVAVPETRLSIVLSRLHCPQRKYQIVLNHEDVLVTTANDQTAWHRCQGRMVVVLYGTSLLQIYSGSKLSWQSCNGSWCRGDCSGNNITTVVFVCWWLNVHFPTNCYWNFRRVWR